MASQQTPNYKLSRWAGTDRILMEEFNDNWDKIDAALLSHAAGLAVRGNCKIEYGTYRGTGKYSAGENRSKLTFSGQPLLVLVCCEVDTLFLVMPYKSMYGNLLTRDPAITGIPVLDWDTPNTVFWYHSKGSREQMNASFTYHYLAFIAADEK